MKPTGSQTYRFCQTECAINEILFENQCYSRFKLSDDCNSTNAWRCPLNSVCKKNKCSCLCTMYPINDRLCGPWPFCPASPDGQHGLSEMNQANERADVSPKETFGNATFCKVAEQKALVDNALEKCPEGQYCSNYLPHVGLCCNKPGTNRKNTKIWITAYNFKNLTCHKQRKTLSYVYAFRQFITF